MDSVSFKSFVKTALALQAGDGSPPDYLITRAAVEAKFPKLAISMGLVNKTLAKNLPKASPQRLARFNNNVRGTARKAMNSGNVRFANKVNSAYGQGIQENLSRIAKLASGSTVANVAEVIGLGALAAPAATHLTTKGKKEWSDKGKAVAEVGGLGILAAPYAHDLAKKSKSYSSVAKAIGKKLPQLLKHG